LYDQTNAAHGCVADIAKIFTIIQTKSQAD